MPSVQQVAQLHLPAIETVNTKNPKICFQDDFYFFFGLRGFLDHLFLVLWQQSICCSFDLCFDWQSIYFVWKRVPPNAFPKYKQHSTAKSTEMHRKNI